jgi:hypothetical protein
MRAWVIAAVAACSGTRHQIEIGPPPAKLTRGTLVSPLCKGDACKCRDTNQKGDGGVGTPAAGRKRFELRLGPSSQELWVTLPDAVLYKSPERAEECYYVDLPPIDVPVELRGSDPAGVSAAWTIRELGTATKSWYDTFAFSCGSPGVCSFEELDQAKARSNGMAKKGVYDPCGSVKVKGLIWDTGRSPDNVHPNELLVKLVLQIYKRAPSREHGADCSKYGKEGAGGDDAAPPPPDGDAAPPP